jgi:hypothetical protein
MNTFKYKLDFYYQVSLIYLVTILVYTGIRGTFIDDRFEFVYRDPLVYIMVFFLLLAFGMLVINRVRNRRIIVEENMIRFKNRFKEWDLPISDIEWMHLTRERTVKTAGRMQVIIIKRKHKRRLLRIRTGRYERPDEFAAAMKVTAERVPKRTPRSKTI